MELSLKESSDAALYAELSGRVTQNDISPFTEPLGKELGADAYGKNVLLDLHNVEVLDSSGISWLLVCHKRFREAGGKLVLHSVSPVVSDMAQATAAPST